VSESYFNRHEQRTSLILGIFFGLAGLAVVLGVLSAVSLRDSTYAFFALSVALMGLSQAANTGIGGLHLWPNLPRWNDLSSMVLPVLAVGSLVWFFSAVVSVPERSRPVPPAAGRPGPAGDRDRGGNSAGPALVPIPAVGALHSWSLRS
jgi:hypothetical protein